MVRRARAVHALSEHLATAYAEVAGEESRIDLDYTSGWTSGIDFDKPGASYATEMQHSLEGSRRADRDRRVTTVGPHRDEPIFLLNDHDARHHASQGEQRTLALALRLATHRAITRVTDTVPVLLLDDVFSELDPGRARALTGALPAAQTLITTADPSHVPVEGVRWAVEGGKVSS